MIAVEKLSKNFGNISAIKDLSFSINDGEIVGLLGPNGAGKTTTMRVLSGFYAPDEGTVNINGSDILTHTQEAQSQIGYLPENNPLYKDMLVEEILDFSLDLKNIQGHERKEALDFAIRSVNIADVYYRPVNELSKGYKQRVGIAVALLHKPKILIMDEPTEGLDPNQRTEIRNLIKNLAKEHTIIISTHVMQEVEAICSRVILISKGELKADSPVHELSRGLKSEKLIQIDIEGKNVKTEIRKISAIKEIQNEQILGDRYSARLIIDTNTEIQPQLSSQIHNNKWTIWRLSEEKLQLEDIFKQLTS
ncbi:hypothetical protein A3K34_03815 [candidate division WWE3 bacterium RIFOXYC1_FULL_40_10]|uniref:ABC transporter domain-containing protein n=1 Tax=candidate division WWE3 bacterium RIFOXYA2_FULL_46_9 TaxID=1802636 RepID=A0A1F4W196_UNCKA|nr:MAG: hypothetical protein A3K58_03815 [candidate division WWE3 bacterium RIFOXYB1_FULL_40_22]OGC61967.1 MAG: hypothetical protein A3K37_03815 [candidate division WWE3 bacterium RIFOXYA1_FULL_40_11]OGC63048.1 MAG: hypothetical protein A2264_03870 [candidate division WWE3 bacterium RIFOXYA2_FULL_46_9]OGC64525.1 MAG: hypothetical protein A2326_03955 [candidate division WWE3 bacterium RIFOXYB2_FULL_41_6]OGC66350.1 MAG: hypothetical protein A3K34_03815 [candidate division WWE3 bacterium RIFOXYC1_